MPNNIPNSTEYVHSNEPNLVNLHKAMEYDSAGRPLLRVRVDGSITVDQLSVDNVEISNDVGNPIPVSDAGGSITVDDGGASITVDGAVNATITGGSVEISYPSDTPIPVVGTTVNQWGNPVLRIDDDTVQHTSKNRRKISGYEIIDYSSFQYDKQDDVWDEFTTGTASSEFDGLKGMVKMQVGSDVGAEAIRQTHRVMRYIPGRPNEASMAVIFGTPTAGIRRRFGIFDEGNGAFFENDGLTYNVVLRRTITTGIEETRVSRENWNIDPLDGTGPSGITADPNAIQLLVIEYEWYGAGHVEFKFIIDNNAIPVHEFRHANRVNYTWASTAFLPIRAEIKNVGGTLGTHTFYHGSHSVLAEGDRGVIGYERTVSSDMDGYRLALGGTFYPVLSLRLKQSRLNGVVVLEEFSAATLDTTNILYRIIKNGTVTGGTWISSGPNSHVEYNNSGTSITGGEIIKSGYISAGNHGSMFQFGDRAIKQLGRRTTTTLADTSDVYTIAISAANNGKDGFASMCWMEVR